MRLLSALKKGWGYTSTSFNSAQKKEELQKIEVQGQIWIDQED